MFNVGQFSKLQIIRTYVEFLEADLTSDGKFNIDALIYLELGKMAHTGEQILHRKIYLTG